jgi:alginate O-acetyltransferase complex protein AlgI
MTFNDPLFFLVFLPLCVAGFALFGRFGRRSAIGFLAFMSMFFYAAWSVPYLLLLAGSILWNFFISRRIFATAEDEPTQTRWLILGIAIDLGALGYFKYLFPFLGLVHKLAHAPWHFTSIILPLGISFFTFTQIAYLVDLKQGVAKPESFLTYTFFVTFFPHLVAGPILHHKDLMPQVREQRRYGLNSNDVALGLTWFFMGMFKKVVIADNISQGANALFENPAHSGMTSAWMGVLAYALQLYFDFSGYSDMALGLARIFSIRFPLNFNSPYKSSSIIDFWQRWHMTLTNYIMSYVYTPFLMSISRRRMEQGKPVSARARATAEGFANLVALPTLFTLFLAGVWHGAGAQFFAYGLAHGGCISLNHAWRTFVPKTSPLRRIVSGPVAVLLTFVFVMLAFVLFRADRGQDAFSVYAGLIGLHGRGAPVDLLSIAKFALLLGVVWLMPNTQEILGEAGERAEGNWSLVKAPGWQPNVLWWATAAVAMLFAVSYANASNTFLYFQF